MINFSIQRRKIASLCIPRIYKVSKKRYFLCTSTFRSIAWHVQNDESCISLVRSESTGFEGFQTSASCRRLWMIWERLSTTFTSILVASGADVASGFACTDISLWFPIFSVTLLLSNITIAHLLLSRQGLEENLSLVEKNL